ncbi:SPC22 domain-containing protein [Ceratobasidium sp. AG-Ba]|nr:SPC22 domain-containing protein [Ceratobasidium sp. AG-Ba]
MYSTYQRINNISAFVSSCLMGLLVAISVVSYIQLSVIGEPTGRLEVKPMGVQRAVSRPYSRKEQDIAFYRFDVQADLSQLFTWNTKQLFVYIIADYTNEKGISNEVVLWDRIVRRKRDARLNLESARGRYALRDPSLTFRNASPANFTLKYNVMPWIGGLTYGTAGQGSKPVPFARVKSSV